MSAWRRPLHFVSIVGLGMSTVTLLLMLPRLFDHGGGAGRVIGNAVAVGWTLVVIALVVAPVRTIGPRAVAGAWFCGFFGVLSLSTLVGRPVIDHFGSTSAFAVVFWAPFTEELLKLAPVALFVLLALRNKRARPSVGDAVLFGATVGGAFAVYENALYARGTGGLGGHVPLSLVAPSLQRTSYGSTSMLVGGHLIYTAVTALGLAITLLYRHRMRGALYAAPVAFVVAFAEHASANEIGLMSGGASRPAWLTPARIVTLDGYLSTFLFIAGLAFAAVVERRSVPTFAATPVTSRLSGYARELLPGLPGRGWRSARLAVVQCAGPAPSIVEGARS